jgi:hypothetical protein
MGDGADRGRHCLNQWETAPRRLWRCANTSSCWGWQSIHIQTSSHGGAAGAEEAAGRGGRSHRDLRRGRKESLGSDGAWPPAWHHPPCWVNEKPAARMEASTLLAPIGGTPVRQPLHGGWAPPQWLHSLLPCLIVSRLSATSIVRSPCLVMWRRGKGEHLHMKSDPVRRGPPPMSVGEAVPRNNGRGRTMPLPNGGPPLPLPGW